MTSDFDRRRQADCEQDRRRERAEREAGRRLEGALAAARSAAADVFFTTLQQDVGPGQQVRLMLSATLNSLKDECVVTRTIFFNMDGTEPTDTQRKLAMAMSAVKAVAPETYDAVLAALKVADRVAEIEDAAASGDAEATALLQAWHGNDDQSREQEEN
jgi:hypothetical protein